MTQGILLIEDEVTLAKNVQKYLGRYDYDVRVADSAKDGLAEFKSFQPDVVLLDYRLPDANGLEIFQRLRDIDPDIRCIFVTGHGSVEVAVEAMKAGAFDYISKPLVLSELKLLLDKVSGQNKLEKTLDYHRNRQASEGGLAAISGASLAMVRLRDQIDHLLEAEVALKDGVPPAALVTGETGTGKQLVARALHFDGPRRDGPFIELNCATLPDQLAESELFGHERGAFTDAKERKIGLIEAADGGTLFLDEVGELSQNAQAKLLNVLESQTVRRVGSVRDRRVNVRIIAATNRSLEDMIAEGKFRADLYYRIRMIEFSMPPLRQRGDDIKLLANNFLAKHTRRYKRPGIKFSEDAMQAMLTHCWPGNVRELTNVVERAVMLCSNDKINAQLLALPATNDASSYDRMQHATVLPLPANGLSLEQVEKELVLGALDRTNWNVSKACRLLGVTRDTLRYRIEKFALNRPGM